MVPMVIYVNLPVDIKRCEKDREGKNEKEKSVCWRDSELTYKILFTLINLKPREEDYRKLTRKNKKKKTDDR